MNNILELTYNCILPWEAGLIAMAVIIVVALLALGLWRLAAYYQTYKSRQRAQALANRPVTELQAEMNQTYRALESFGSILKKSMSKSIDSPINCLSNGGNNKLFFNFSKDKEKSSKIQILGQLNWSPSFYPNFSSHETIGKPTP